MANIREILRVDIAEIPPFITGQVCQSIKSCNMDLVISVISAISVKVSGGNEGQISS